jgi:L-aspartate oxidase
MPEPQTQAEHELANLTLLGRLMAQAALTRTESRGGHYRADYPTTDPEWRRHISLDVVTASVARREPVVAEPAR